MIVLERSLRIRIVRALLVILIPNLDFFRKEIVIFRFRNMRNKWLSRILTVRFGFYGVENPRRRIISACAAEISLGTILLGKCHL